MADAQPTIRYTQRAGKPVIEVAGTWTVFSLRGIRRMAEKALQAAGAGKANRIVDAKKVERLDTAGALEILLLAGGPEAQIETADKAHADLFKVVQDNMCEAPAERHPSWLAHWLEEIGRNTVHLYEQGVNLASFFGEILVTFVEACLQPKRFRLNAVVRQMYEVWIRALVIVGVLTFLIGVVIAYQGVQQLKQFGAETFTVEAVGIGMFRELGVLLTAIIVAGRSGSAFTAQIGTMQVNQEVDAMRTIGLNPIEWLVLPRISALVISMPLLAFWGDMTGLLGGAVACTVYLDFTFVQFFERLRDTVGVWHFYVGMIKAPVFGAVIAIIGCFEGLQVQRQRRERRPAHDQVGRRIDLLRHRARRDILDHLPAGERVMADTAAPAKEHAEKPAPPKLFEGGQLVDHRDGRDVVLKLRGVRTQFGDNIIHDNLDFDVFRGEIVGLVGGSGTGKSVLLRTIIGLNRHTKGTIEMLGVDTATLHGKAERGDAGAHRRAVPGRRAVLLAERHREHHRADPRACRPRGADDARHCRAQGRDGRPAGGRRRQEAFGAFRRHAQARQPRPRPGARPGPAVPRRADRRSRPDRRGALRRAGQGPEQEPWRHDSHGHPRFGQPLCGL